MPVNLRIIHIFRAPAGGLFRHVRDLARGQSELGHEVGIICDSTTGGSAAEAALKEIAKHCRLGVFRTKMARLPGLGDLAASYSLARVCRKLRPNVLHGHGAKGGVYARLAGKRHDIKSIYTPHGGSLHYEWRQPQGALFLASERALRGLTSGLVFVCDYERRAFNRKIGMADVPCRVIYNGLWPEDFVEVRPAADATDLLFIGELRELKGVSDLLTAFSQLSTQRKASLTITGDGPDRKEFESQARKLNLIDRVRFTGALPARQAFSLGRVFVMPSRAESFPYVVLEAGAAGLPMVATQVGGIPEMVPASDLVPSQKPHVLAAAIARKLAAPDDALAAAANLRADLQQRFAASSMCARVISFYRIVLDR